MIVFDTPNRRPYLSIGGHTERFETASYRLIPSTDAYVFSPSNAFVLTSSASVYLEGTLANAVYTPVA